MPECKLPNVCSRRGNKAGSGVFGPTVDSGAVLSALNDHINNLPDILLVYDCCYASSIDDKGLKRADAIVWGLFAGGYESEVPNAGPHSFTSSLTAALYKLRRNNRPIWLPELCREVIRELFDTWSPGVLKDQDNKARLTRDKLPRIYTPLQSSPRVESIAARSQRSMFLPIIFRSTDPSNSLATVGKVRNMPI